MELVKDRFCSFGDELYQFYEPILAGESVQIFVWNTRRPPPLAPGEKYPPYARDLELFSIAVYENGELVDTVRDPRCKAVGLNELLGVKKNLWQCELSAKQINSLLPILKNIFTEN